MKRILFLSLWAVLALVACSDDDDDSNTINWETLIYQSVLDMADGTLMNILDTYGEYSMQGSMTDTLNHKGTFITTNAVICKKEAGNGYRITFWDKFNEEICSMEISGFSHLFVGEGIANPYLKNLYLAPYEPSNNLNLQELMSRQITLNYMYVTDRKGIVWWWAEKMKSNITEEAMQKLYDNYPYTKTPLK